MRRGAVAGLVAALALGGASSAAAQQQPQNPLAPIVVPRAELGKIAQGLQIKLLSGTTTNARAADDSFDPNDTAATVSRAGRVSGYTLVYGDVGWTALRRDHGLIDVGTSLDYFRSPAQAGGFEVKSLRDLRRLRGKNLDGVVLERASAFEVRGLGPAATGLEIVQRVGRHRIYATVIDFQIDRILCEAVVNRADSANVRRQVAAIAGKLRNRLAAYARRRLNEPPVKLPRPLGLVKPGGGAPDLSAMVPTNSDLKGKGGGVQQGFVPDNDAITSYVREYQFGPSSGLFQLRATVALERTPREASGRLFLTRSVFTGPEAAVALAHLAAPAPTVVHLDATRSAKVGDESFVTATSFNSQGRRLRAVLVYERRDRVIGSILLIGTAKKLTLEGALPYARMLDKRIRGAVNPALVA